jgi:hypothetical protein
VVMEIFKARAMSVMDRFFFTFFSLQSRPEYAKKRAVHQRFWHWGHKKENPAVINTGIYYCRIFYYQVLEADNRRGCTSRMRFKIISGN